MSEKGVGRPFIFVLLREGSSDEGLIAHLRTLLVRAGLSEVVGSARPYNGTVEQKVQKVLGEGASIDCLFIHRDADTQKSDVRHDEIANGVAAINSALDYVAVVPIQELEAWLLVDEVAIRQVVGRPKGKLDLKLPSVASIEKVASPKELLRASLVVASEQTGRRRDKVRRSFDRHRWLLLERLDIDGPVRTLSAWSRLESDVAAVVDGITA